ncbi:MAG: GNAT family N-acetyltransferase [Chitinophagales bacterium]
MIEIIDYSDEYANDFKDLNSEWLYKYNLAESHDLEIINDPKGMILDRGGYIYLAKAGDKIVGTAGLANEGNSVFELVKMSVVPAFQGKGISKMLIEKCLNKMRELKAKKIFLYSNSQLTTAIALYKKYGFVHVDASNAPLITADIKMELSFLQTEPTGEYEQPKKSLD